MLHRAFRLSSSWKYFTEECERLKQLFRQLRYPQTLVDNTIAKFIAKRNEQSNPAPVDETRKQSILRIVLPFKDQKSANIVRRQLNDLGTRIGIIFQPVYISKKLESALHVPEKKPPLARPARGGQKGQNTWGPDWFGGPEILIKHLLIALLSRGLGGRNA